jgi:hypothetical protein
VVALAHAGKDEEIQPLARHLRQQGNLTIALLLRAALSGSRAFVESGFAELAGLSPARAAGLLREPKSAGFAALYRKTDLPTQFLAVFRTALIALDEARIAPGDQLSWIATERVIEVCEKAQAPGLEKLMSLLRRYEAEAARGEARLYAAETGSSCEGPLTFARFDVSPAADVAPAIAPHVTLSLEAVSAALGVEIPAVELAGLADAA